MTCVILDCWPHLLPRIINARSNQMNTAKLEKDLNLEADVMTGWATEGYEWDPYRLQAHLIKQDEGAEQYAHFLAPSSFVCPFISRVFFAHSGQWHSRRPLTQRWRLAAALVRSSRGAGGDQQAAQGPAPLPGRRMRERSNAREVILPETPNLVRFASSGPLDRTVVVTLCTESRHPPALIASFS